MKNLDIQTQKKKRGLTLIEALIVLAVFAGVVAGVLALVNNVQRNAAVSEETTNLTSIYGNIDSYFRRGTTAGLINELAVSAGFLPGGMLIEEDGEDIANSFGGYVQILGSDGGGINNSRGFSVQYNRVPTAACVNFVQGQVRTGWDTVGVVGNEDGDVGDFSATPTDYFSSDTGGGLGSVAGSRGNTPLSEIRIIDMCNVDTNYVHVVFVKDSGATL